MTFNSGINGRPPQPPNQLPTPRNPGAAMMSRNQSSAAAFKPLVMARRREAQQPSQRSVVTNLATNNAPPPPPHPPFAAYRSFGGGTNLSRSQSQFVAGERRAPRVFPPPQPRVQQPPPVLRPQQRVPPPLPTQPRLHPQQQQPWYDLSTTPSCSSTASSSETDLRAAALFRRHEVSRNFSSAGDSKFAPAPPHRPQQRPPRLLSYSSSFCSPMGNVARERQRLASAGALHDGGVAPESVPFQRRKKSVKDCIVS